MSQDTPNKSVVAPELHPSIGFLLRLQPVFLPASRPRAGDGAGHLGRTDTGRLVSRVGRPSGPSWLSVCRFQGAMVKQVFVERLVCAGLPA